MTASTALIWPMLVQIGLTFALILAAGRARVRAIRRKRVRMGDIALSGESWPQDVRQVANSMNNQFETPILFYALALAATLLGATAWPMATLAWLYVASRIAHAGVHVTSNNVPRRFQVFAFGLACLGLMWLGLAWTALQALAR